MASQVGLRGRDLFFALGTDAARRVDWTLWRSARPGGDLTIATLDRVIEATVVEQPVVADDGSEVLVVESRGRQLRLRLCLSSASAGYWDRHPDERYPGCDRDVEVDGQTARLVSLRSPPPEQLGLFGDPMTEQERIIKAKRQGNHMVGPVERVR